MPARVVTLTALALCALRGALTFPSGQASQYAHHGPAHPASAHTWTVALPQAPPEALLAELAARSAPGSAQYGAWLARGAAAALISPAPHVRAAVAAHHAAAGARCSHGPSSLTCTAPVAVVNALYNTTLHRYSGGGHGALLRVPPGRALALHPGIAFVTRLHDFPQPRRGAARALAQRGAPPGKQQRQQRGLTAAPASFCDCTVPACEGALCASCFCDWMVAPESLERIYGTGAAVGQGSAASGVAAVAFDSPEPLREDLAFFAQHTSTAPPPWPVYAPVAYANLTAPFHGYGAPQHPPDYTSAASAYGETILDAEYLAALAPAAPQGVWLEPASAWVYEFTEHVLGALAAGSPLPHVFTLSHGRAERQQCESTYADDSDDYFAACAQGVAGYIATCNANLAAMGAAGLTVVVASGDDGAHSDADQGCSAAGVAPEWPASSPYVLSVGATQLVGALPLEAREAAAPMASRFCDTVSFCADSGGREVAASASAAAPGAPAPALVTSGGGFSTLSARPPWQDAAVGAYLAATPRLPPGSAGAAGRGYPDLAALGHNIAVYQYAGGEGGLPEVYAESSWRAVDGSAAAAPVIAGLLAVANGARAGAGLPALGLVAPALYAIAAADPGAFGDVTEGDNRCTRGACCASGYSAGAGWDPVTGLGSPRAPALLAALAALAAPGAARLPSPSPPPPPPPPRPPQPPAPAAYALTLSGLPPAAYASTSVRAALAAACLAALGNSSSSSSGWGGGGSAGGSGNVSVSVALVTVEGSGGGRGRGGVLYDGGRRALWGGGGGGGGGARGAQAAGAGAGSASPPPLPLPAARVVFTAAAGTAARAAAVAASATAAGFGGALVAAAPAAGAALGLSAAQFPAAALRASGGATAVALPVPGAATAAAAAAGDGNDDEAGVGAEQGGGEGAGSGDSAAALGAGAAAGVAVAVLLVSCGAAGAALWRCHSSSSSSEGSDAAGSLPALPLHEQQQRQWELGSFVVRNVVGEGGGLPPRKGAGV